MSHRGLAALLTVLTGSTFVFANLATPFGVSATTAPIIVVARCEKHESTSDVLRVLEVVKGQTVLESVSLTRTEWLYRPLETGGLYLIQLDLERRPWVGGLTADADPEKRVPAHGCGTVNVMRVVDGYMHDFYFFVTKGDGTRVTLEEAKRNLDLLNYEF